MAKRDVEATTIRFQRVWDSSQTAIGRNRCLATTRADVPDAAAAAAAAGDNASKLADRNWKMSDGSVATLADVI